MDVQASQEDCAARGGSLVNIDRKEEQEFLVRKITERGGEWRFWIGLQQTASGEWLWQDYTPLDTMQLWCPGELTTGEEFGSGGDFYSNRHHGYLEAEEDCWGNGFDSSHYRRICERAVQI
ncbi:CLC9A protein, partial [Amia calva]|nr:CLC9A protein [Amia calva]